MGSLSGADALTKVRFRYTPTLVLGPHLQGRLRRNAQRKFGYMLEPPSIFSTMKGKNEKCGQSAGKLLIYLRAPQRLYADILEAG